jgi:hypothetical protein
LGFRIENLAYRYDAYVNAYFDHRGFNIGRYLTDVREYHFARYYPAAAATTTVHVYPARIPQSQPVNSPSDLEVVEGTSSLEFRIENLPYRFDNYIGAYFDQQRQKYWAHRRGCARASLRTLLPG